MPKAFDTLLYLVEHRGRVLGKEELLSAVWTGTIVEENNLTQNISILRRVLGEKHGDNLFIATIPGQGYKFVADVRNGKTESSVASAPVAASTTLVSHGNQVKASVPHQTKNRFWPFAIIGISVLLIGSYGFYAWRGNTPPSDTPIQSIAVLPFKPVVADNRNEALEMGMADSLINKISTSTGVTVRPLSSVRRYTALDQDALIAGRQLGVDSILEGSVQTSGDRIRISARLLRTVDGKQLWTGQF